MLLKYTIADAFCDPEKKFSGNPAAVCLLECDNEISDKIKGKIGAQLNLSETAFVSKSWCESNTQLSPNHFTIRWFSPTHEVALCGHATLASSKVLFDRIGKGSDKETTIHFETKSKGNLSATMNWSTGRISLNFPIAPVIPATESGMEILSQFVPYAIHPFDTTVVHSVHYAPLTKYLYIRLHDECSEKMLTDLKPDFFNLCAIKGNDVVIGLNVTVKGSHDVDFYSRFFAPWLGVNEDPVCGSAHCALAPYWSNVLNRKDLLAKQCSERVGYLHCKIDDFNAERVTLEGDCKIFAFGEMFL